ncbi:unannotated protein [freshwater metagenome]|uniref:Unannotated protein n=1 Tax=freshwater metagenome TaxID=449393 RepID=A0A6J6KMP8_9ZZZZ
MLSTNQSPVAAHEPTLSSGIIANIRGETRSRLTVMALAHVRIALGSVGISLFFLVELAGVGSDGD